jgi:hypothetical protein
MNITIIGFGKMGQLRKTIIEKMNEEEGFKP